MNLLIRLSLAPALFIWSCGDTPSNPVGSDTPPSIRMESAPDMHDAANSLDYTGTYRGILPCADCEGIATELTLVYDNTFTLKSTYLGKGDASEQVRTGFYSFQKHGSIITLIGMDAPNRFFTGENVLWPLDKEGNRPTGEAADKHALRK